ncbi:hypothetical protein ACS0TY_000017 [Phlomoides rotata]
MWVIITGEEDRETHREIDNRTFFFHLALTKILFTLQQFIVNFLFRPFLFAIFLAILLLVPTADNRDWIHRRKG